MKAIVQRRYGAPADVLHPGDVPTPQVGAGQVLVRVRSASVQVGAYFAVLGSPVVVRVFTGIRRPKFAVPGLDLAGEVVATGAGVTRFKTGDEVFGSSTGTLAEYAAAPEKTLALKPGSISFEEASALPTSGLAALHGLRDAGRLQPGQHVLINGASGAVGSFAVQIAKEMGATVTGVCSTRNLEFVMELGADHVIDYTQQDFTRGDARYDVVFDNVENRSLGDVRRVLVPGGTLVLNSGTGVGGLRLMSRLIRPMLLNPFVSQRLVRYLSNPNDADLDHLADLAASSKIRPVVGSTFPLAATTSAFEVIASRHSQGNVVVVVTVPSA